MRIIAAEGHAMETIDITRTLYKVSDFLSWQKAGTLELSPNFQRRPVWSAGAKAYLIDTVVRGLPVPIIFMRERTDLKSFEPRREIVDGQQRLRTILSYIDPTCLRDYDPNRDYFPIKPELNSELGNKDFLKLPESLKRRVLDYQFSVHILPSDADDRLVLQIFARMNATGVKLNGQELRNAKWFGQFKTSMYQLAYEYLPKWRQWSIFTETNIARMLEVEATSDLCALILQGTFGMSQTSLDKIYKDYDEVFLARAEVERRFRATMESIDAVIGELLSNTVFSSRLLFYATFALFYDLLFTIGSELKRKAQAKLPSDLMGSLLDIDTRISVGEIPESVATAISRRTTHPSTRKMIFDFLKKTV